MLVNVREVIRVSSLLNFIKSYHDRFKDEIKKWYEDLQQTNPDISYDDIFEYNLYNYTDSDYKELERILDYDKNNRWLVVYNDGSDTFELYNIA